MDNVTVHIGLDHLVRDILVPVDDTAPTYSSMVEVHDQRTSGYLGVGMAF